MSSDTQLVQDFDGKYTYSSIVAVQFSNEQQLRVYPNPAEQVVTIRFFSTVENKCIRSLYDATGKWIRSTIDIPVS